LELWSRIHRAEEALIALVPPLELEAMFVREQMRLEGVGDVSPVLAGVVENVGRWLAGLSGRVPQEPSIQEPPLPSAPLPPITDLQRARDGLREVAHVINRFREYNSAGLVHLRAQTVMGILIIEGLACGLLALAIEGGASRTALEAGAVYFLVGATVGLLNHALQLRHAVLSIDDYGLQRARVRLLPVVSGVAGIAGAVAVDLVARFGTAGAAPASAAAGAASLSQLFDLNMHPGGLVFAAVFGIAPGVFVARFLDVAKTLENAIQSTQLTPYHRDLSDSGG
jgi:hypothetical protein